jgi:PKHD-type hydroxylase|tara:strand:- start:1000 stop:1596 length:597 start_codon:yes stop_codon:yes gene_type:complete
MIIYEPKWKSYICKTDEPIFTPEECNLIIQIGRNEKIVEGTISHVKKKIDDEIGQVDKKIRTSHISWIPFNKMTSFYKKIEATMIRTNGNHFGFDGMTISEQAQYTEYDEDGFYNWHTDSDPIMIHEPPVRKISMSLLLSQENEFEGGGLEITEEGKVIDLKQGHAIFFASFLAHRVKPITKGNRKSLVMWFGGPPLK